MTVSPYSFFIERNNEYYIANLLTRSILQIDKSVYLILKNNSVQINSSLISPSIFNELKKFRIVINSISEEYDFCASIIKRNRTIERSVHITIAPTMDCCFSCPYCFEASKNKAYISSEVIDSLVRYLSDNSQIEKIHVTWFGGEPLMAIDKIEEFYTKLHSKFKGEYDSDIITTAFHINEQNINILEKIGVSEIQITLDGKEEYHNKIKKVGNVNVFKKVLSNIDLLSKKSSLKIQIRINLSKENEIDYVDLYNYLSLRYKNRNVTIVPGFIKNRNGCLDDCIFHNSKEIAQFSLRLWNIHKIPTPWIIYDNDIVECAIRNPHSFVIDPNGFIYKCWEKIGNDQYCIGKITQEGKIKILNTNVLNKCLSNEDPLLSQMCKKCNYLPVCFGGCPILRLENGEGKSNELCTSHKGHLREWVLSYIDYISQ